MLPLALGGPAHPGEHIRHDTFTWDGSSTPRAATGTWWPGPLRGTAPAGSAAQSGSDPAFARLNTA